MRYALVKDGIIQNVIVCEPEFLSNIQSNWDYCVRVDEIFKPAKWVRGEEEVYLLPPIEELEQWTYDPGQEEPAIGWSYDGTNFSKPIE
jgi:hypothetical protein